MDNGYFKNPTAINIVNGYRENSIYIDDSIANGSKPYVVDENNNIIVGDRKNPFDGSDKAPHPTLIGGYNPRVKCAGMMMFVDGKILWYDDRSGHYKPDRKSLKIVGEILNSLKESYPDMFAKDYIGMKVKKKK